MPRSHITVSSFAPQKRQGRRCGRLVGLVFSAREMTDDIAENVLADVEIMLAQVASASAEQSSKAQAITEKRFASEVEAVA